MFNDSDPILDGITAYGPFLARLTQVMSGSGAQANLWLYSFIEQSFDSNGFPVDASPPRQTSPSSGAPVSSYAIEANNTLLTVPGSTPTGYTNPGPYVEMRLKGVVGGAPVYEFDVGQSTVVVVKPTTTTPSTITLPGGATTSGYAAKLESWSNTTGLWSDGGTVWFIGANSETPTSGTRYVCKQIGADGSGVSIWTQQVPATPSTYANASIITSDVSLSSTPGTASQIFTFTAPFTGSFYVQANVTGLLSVTGSGTNPAGSAYIVAYFLVNGAAPTNGGITSAYVVRVDVPLNTSSSYPLGGFPAGGSVSMFLRVSLSSGDVLTLNAAVKNINSSGGAGFTDTAWIQGAADVYNPGLTTHNPTQWTIYQGY